jgi:multicomponent Na+:H+ antiporter subunit G
MTEWISFGACALFVGAGLIITVISILGTQKQDFALNRIHFAGMTDTLGFFLIITGLIIASGFTFTSLKLLAVLGLMWCTSPVSGHFLSRLEYETDPNLDKHCRRMDSHDLPGVMSDAPVADESEVR